MTDQVQAEAVTETVSEVETPSTMPAVQDSERRAREFMANRGIELPDDPPAATGEPPGESQPSNTDPPPEAPQPPAQEMTLGEPPPAKERSKFDYYEERRQKRELKQQLAQREAQLQGMQSVLERFQNMGLPANAAPEPEPEPEIVIPDMKDDPQGHIEAKFQLLDRREAQLNEKLASYDKFIEDRKSQEKTQQVLGKVYENVSRQSQDHEAKNPGYFDRVQELAQDTIRYHMAYGDTPQEAQAKANAQMQGLILRAMKTDTAVPELVEEAYVRRFGERKPQPSTGQQPQPGNQQPGRDPQVAAMNKAKAEGVTGTIAANGAPDRHQINARNVMRHGLTPEQTGELMAAGGVRALSALTEQMQNLKR